MEERDLEAGASVEKTPPEDPAREERERRPGEEGEDAPAAAAVEAVPGREPRVGGRLADRVREVAIGEVEEGLGEVLHLAVHLDRLVASPARRPEAARAQAEAHLP